MDKVLVVDDDPEVLNLLQEGLRRYRGQFEILTASDGQEAIGFLKTHHTSVLVTDLDMRKVDGLEILAYTFTNHPKTSCIVITEREISRLKRPGREDILRYIEKPVDSDRLAAAIMERLDDMDEHRSISGVSVSHFLDLIEVGRKTCLLEVHCGRERRGFFYFVQGVLHNALCDDLKGENAATRMVGWNHVCIRAKSFPSDGDKERINVIIRKRPTGDGYDHTSGRLAPTGYPIP